MIGLKIAGVSVVLFILFSLLVTAARRPPVDYGIARVMLALWFLALLGMFGGVIVAIIQA